MYKLESGILALILLQCSLNREDGENISEQYDPSHPQFGGNPRNIPETGILVGTKPIGGPSAQRTERV